MKHQTISYHDLHTLATMAGVTISEHGGGLPGYYDHTRQLISIRNDLGPVNRVCVMAHEIGHAYHQDSGPATSRQERRADIFAARLLITPHQYAYAENLYGPNLPAIANELGVTVYLTRLWCDTYRMNPRQVAPLNPKVILHNITNEGTLQR